MAKGTDGHEKGHKGGGTALAHRRLSRGWSGAGGSSRLRSSCALGTELGWAWWPLAGQEMTVVVQHPETAQRG